ncbi:MAG: hypothetical protein OIF57_08690, partial [Marinobacterium sp.]|nr:hypothetical protein [Marinobacterium sp.]
MQEYGDIQHLRGSTAANAAHVGLPGTWTLDVEAGAIHIHDGVTPGGSFQIRSQQLLNAGISFKANPEHYIAASAQQEINPGAVDLSDPEKISVTVNKVRLKSGWSVSGPNIRFDQPLVGGEQIEVCNIHSLKEIVEQFSASPVDAEQLLQQVNQHLNSPATLQTLA